MNMKNQDLSAEKAASSPPADSAPDLMRLVDNLHNQQNELKQREDELRRLNTELHLANQRYFQNFLSAPLPILRINREGTILEANLQASDILGEEFNTWKYHPLTLRVLFRNEKTFSNLMEILNQATQRGHSKRLEIEIQPARQNTSRYCVVYALPLVPIEADDPTPTEILLYFFDISGLQQTMNSLREANQTLVETYRLASSEARQAKQENSHKNLFLAQMSHEIRTPLNGVMGMLELLRESQLDSQQKDYLDIVHRSSESLINLVNGILDLAALEEGKKHIPPAPFHLVETISGWIKPFAGKARKQGLGFHLIVAPDIEAEVIGPREHLQKILQILLDRALAHTEEGKIILAVQHGDSPHPEGQSLHFEVRDTSPGIPAANEKKIFSLPGEVRTSVSDLLTGNGFDLPVASKLVQLLGGQLALDNRPGEGCTFSFSLQFESFSGHPAKTSTSGPVEEPPTPVRQAAPAHILVVEDQPINQRVAQAILENLGHEAGFAFHGREALKLLEQKSWDLILMDLAMPEMDGLEATRKIRSREKEEGTARTPIIAMTAYALEGDRERCLAAGMDDYLPKPITIESLRQVINRWLKHPQ